MRQPCKAILFIGPNGVLTNIEIKLLIDDRADHIGLRSALLWAENAAVPTAGLSRQILDDEVDADDNRDDNDNESKSFAESEWEPS